MHVERSILTFIGIFLFLLGLNDGHTGFLPIPSIIPVPLTLPNTPLIAYPGTRSCSGQLPDAPRSPAMAAHPQLRAQPGDKYLNRNLQNYFKRKYD
jgi:hypothetical protein